MALLSYLLAIPITLGLAAAQTTPLSTGIATPTPTCLQPRQPTDPAASSIASALSSAVPNACNPNLEKPSINGTQYIENYHFDSLNFNVSHLVNAPSDIPSPSTCPDSFNAIISKCIQNAPGVAFWGGWMLQGTNNYSISNFNYPANGLASLSSSAAGPLSSFVGTGPPLSRSVIGASGSLPLSMQTYSSLSSSTWSYSWQSGTVSQSKKDQSSGRVTRAAASSASASTDEIRPKPSVSVLDTAPGSARPVISSRSIVSGSVYSLVGSMSRPSIGGSGTLSISGTPASGTAPIGSPIVVSSASKSGGQSASVILLSNTMSSSSPPLGTGQSPITVRSSRMPATSPSGTSSLPAPGSTVSNPGPSSTPSSLTSSLALATSLTPLPSFTLPPTGVSIAPSGTTASSEGVIFGGLLFALSNSIHGVDLTVPTVKAEVIQEVDNTISKAKNLFQDFGGVDPTGSCGGGGKIKRVPNPFTGLKNLAGDITKVIGCANEVLNSLKVNLDQNTPDPGLTDDLLGDLSTLAGETDPNDDPSKSASARSASESSASQHSVSQASSTYSNFSPSSGSSSSAASSSSSSPSSSSASGCTGCCVTDVPVLPISGTPAVTAVPTDFDALDKRIIPERFQQMAKRRPDRPIAKINNCQLATPNNWPVTTPAYPGGYEYYTSDTSGILGTLTTVSRYYRSTAVGAPACTPTITRINAAQWTFQQSGNVPENDKISVDHAYENGFLTSFMESIIDQANGITCVNANKQFFDTTNCPDNRLQPIFGSLPSYANPDFIAMSQWLNGDAKGWVLGPTFDPQLGGALLPGSKVRPFDNWQGAMQKIKNKMRLAQILVEAALIINADDTVARMQRTNNRIYAAFQTFDTYLSQHSGLPRANFGWASHYKTYMDNYVNYRNGATTRLFPGLLANVAADLTVANNNVAGKVQAEWDQWNNLYNAMNTHYGANGNGAGDINWSINWEWSTNNVKREEIDKIMVKRQACSRPAGPSSGSDPTATGSGMSAPGVGGTKSAVGATGGSGLSSSSSPVSTPGRSSSIFGTGSGFTGMGTGSSATSMPAITPTQCMSDGAPWLSPTAFCDCGLSATYSTISLPTSFPSYSSAICNFTSGVPSKTIQPISTSAAPTNIPGMNGLSQCVLKLAGDANAGGCPGVDYCNCNGVYVKPKTTSTVMSATSSGGSPIISAVPDCNYITLQPTAQDCPVNTASISSASSASAASASRVSAAQPTASGQCFPYHDVNDLKIEAPGINGFCEGNTSDWISSGSIDPSSPAGNNYVSSGYTLASNAPPECKDLYKNGHSDYVTLLCSAPLNQLVNDCPYNGGKISNACGEWWLQTCPLASTCSVGCPGGPFPVGDHKCGKPWPPPKG